MTTEDKLLKLRELADAMYYAAQYLTTDASRLHKAMDEYHQFIIHEYHKEEPVSEDTPFEPIGIPADAVELANIPNKKEPTIPDIVDEHWWEMLGEEPVSEDLEEVAHQYYKPNETFMDGFKKGANWQKQQMIKELAEVKKKYEKVCKENRHLEREIDRLKLTRL